MLVKTVRRVTTLAMYLGLIFSLVVQVANAQTPEKTASQNRIVITNISDSTQIDSDQNVEVKNINKSNVDERVDGSIVTAVEKNMLDKSTKSERDSLVKRIKEDYNNNKYILFYGNKHNMPTEQFMYDILGIKDSVITEFVDDEAKKTQERLVAYGIVKKANGRFHIDRYFAEPGSDLSDLNKQKDFLVSGVKKTFGIKDEKIIKNKSKDAVELQSVVDNPDYTNSENWNYGKYGKLANTTYADKAYSNSTTSYWDVMYSTATTAGWTLYSDSWWVVADLITRSSVAAFANEQVIDHGPTSSSGDYATVGLSGTAPAVSWNFYLNSVDVTDLSVRPDYGRWEFDYPNLTFGSASTASFVSKPGIRATNTVGKFALDTSHAITFWDGLIGIDYVTKNTGVYRYLYNDR